MTSFRRMLDTNIVSDLLRNPQGRVAVKLRQHGSSTSCLSMITATELRFGAVKRRSPQLALRVDTLLTKIAALPFDAPCDAAYGRLRAGLEAAGTPIGPLDLLIAAHALELQITEVRREAAYGVNPTRASHRLAFRPARSHS